MASQVFLDDDGYIHSTYDGPQTAATVTGMADDAVRLCNQLRQQQRPVLLLIDAAGVSGQDAGARQAGFELLRNLDYDRAAAFGASPFLRAVINLVIRATGRADHIKYCDSEAEAKAYLRQEAS